VKSLSVFALLLGFVVTTTAGEAPRPPCDGSSVKPSFGPLGSPPNVRVWASGALGDHWHPPACTGWAPAAGMLVALAGKFRFEGSADDLLTRIGAVSALRGIRYWSVSDNEWRTLIEHASALEGPDLSRPRPDFVAAELKKARIVYFAQDDNRTAGEIIYRLEIRDLAPDRLVVATENVSPVRQFMLTLVDSGGLQALHFLNRDSPGVWRYYVLARTSEDVSSLLGVSQRSYVNRAVAFYRHFIGVPTDLDPPLAP
jgi:hypothetical protein